MNGLDESINHLPESVNQLPESINQLPESVNCGFEVVELSPGVHQLPFRVR